MSGRTATRTPVLRLIVTVGVATSLAILVGGPATAGSAEVTGDAPAAPEWTYAADEPLADGDIEARATGEGVTRDEAERRLRADRAAARLQDNAESRWPETFAGLWIDHDPYRVNVAFTRDASANVAELRTGFPYPDDLYAVDARFSRKSLTLLQSRLATERATLQQGRDAPGMPEAIRTTRGNYDLDIDTVAGEVVVRLARPTDALRGAFAQRYPGPVSVRAGLAQPRTCRQDDCRYAMLAGLRLGLGYDGSRGSCSSAFTAYLTANASYRYVLSAAHCLTRSGTGYRVNGGELYGETTAYRASYEVDVERVRRTDPTPWRESSKFFVEGERYPRMVNSVTTYSATAIGTYVGKTGATTGTTRGYITSKDAAPAYIANSRNFVTADMCSYDGDSGGAVWSSNSAYGIVSGAYALTRCRDITGAMGTTTSSAGGTTIFGALSYATAAMGVTILTGVNLKPTADFTSSCFLADCSFDASTSTDDDGGITSYTWDFGDGEAGSGMTATHSYRLPGAYTVTLTTKDNNGASTTRSVGTVVTET